MGKTKEDAMNLYNAIDKIYCGYAKHKDEDFALYELLKTYKAYIRKAERRGRRKERESIKKVYEDSFSGDCVSVTFVRESPFNAKKVNMLIRKLRDIAFKAGENGLKSPPFYDDEVLEKDNELRKELGIEDCTP